MRVISQPNSGITLGKLLNAALNGEQGAFDQLRIAVAYVKHAGVQHIADSLRKFIRNGGNTNFVVGIDQYGTSLDGLRLLLEIVNKHGNIFINHDENPYVTFHPKLFLFESSKKALVFVGSGNLTEGGLYTNDEAFAEIEIDKFDKTDLGLLSAIHDAFSAWSDEKLPTVIPLTPKFLSKLVETGYVRSENNELSEPLDERKLEARQSSDQISQLPRERFFGRTPRLRPSRPRKLTKEISVRIKHSGVAGSPREVSMVDGFVMTLMRTDVGTGQTTPGASRRSPEIFIPLSARNMNPSFWGWPNFFKEDLKRRGKFDRMGVRMRLGGEVINVNMMTWPVKHDFRLRSESLRSAGEIGDLLRLEIAKGKVGFNYYATIIPQGTEDHTYYSTFCVNVTRNSGKTWGYY